jgi:hypothetical protein
MTYPLGNKLLDFIEGHAEHKGGPNGPLLLRNEVAQALGFVLGSYLKNLTNPHDQMGFADVVREEASLVVKQATRQ